MIIEYLKAPPSPRRTHESHCPHGNYGARSGTPCDALGLGDPKLSDDQLLGAMMVHPILINRPIVVTPADVKLCRPSEAVLDMLESLQRGSFVKDDGEPVVDRHGNRILRPAP